ncbi:MAG: M48 family metallopeptidase [Candidatus Kerfeldbacteria bacterium]|nr:M48 family metallopeptidase [Candidatus Kerfeldbacteria bacterium]
MTAYQQIASNKRRSVLLVVLFIGMILLIGWVLSYASETGPAALVFAVIIATMMSLVSYYAGDKIALFSAGAHGPIQTADQPYVYRLVENLCITAGMPLPKIYIIDDPVPNAFATGRDPQHASIAVTTGIIKLLENEELEGVIAHELSHVKNYDIRLMTIVIICVGIVSLLANFFFRFSFIGGGQRRDSRSGGNAGLVLLLVGLVLMIVSPLISKIIQLAVSRKREFLADASGALLTRYPEGLARALEKIDQHSAPLQRINSATAHLYIANPFGSTKRSWRNLFSTHPPIIERVQALRSMA